MHSAPSRSFVANSFVFILLSCLLINVVAEEFDLGLTEPSLEAITTEEHNMHNFKEQEINNSNNNNDANNIKKENENTSKGTEFQLNLEVTDQDPKPTYQHQQQHKKKIPRPATASSISKECATLIEKHAPAVRRELQAIVDTIFAAKKKKGKRYKLKMLIFGKMDEVAKLLITANKNGNNLLIADRSIDVDDSKLQELQNIVPKSSSLSIQYVTYQTQMRKAQQLLDDNSKWYADLWLHSADNFLLQDDWDAIIIDGPSHTYLQDAGRMQPIFTAAILSRLGAKREVFAIARESFAPVDKVYLKVFFNKGKDAAINVKTVGTTSFFTMFADGSKSQLSLYRNSKKSFSAFVQGKTIFI